MKKLNKWLVVGLSLIVMLSLGLSALVVHSHAYSITDWSQQRYMLPISYYIQEADYDIVHQLDLPSSIYWGDLSYSVNGWSKHGGDLGADDYIRFNFDAGEVYSIPDITGGAGRTVFTNPKSISGLLDLMAPSDLNGIFEFDSTSYTDLELVIVCDFHCQVSNTLFGGDENDRWSVDEAYTYSMPFVDETMPDGRSIFLSYDFSQHLIDTQQRMAENISLRIGSDLDDDPINYIYFTDFYFDISFQVSGYHSELGLHVFPADMYYGDSFFIRHETNTGIVKSLPSFLASPVIENIVTEPVPPQGIIDWLVDTVSGIFDTSLFGIPGLTLGTLLLIPICAGAVVGLLKLFAGG